MIQNIIRSSLSPCDTRERLGVAEPGLGLFELFLLVEEVSAVVLVLLAQTLFLGHDALHIVIEQVGLFVLA